MSMDTEERIRKLEETQGDIKSTLSEVHTTVALTKQAIEHLKENQTKLINKDAKDEERSRGTIRQLWMFGAGGIITTFVSWLARVGGFGAQ